MDWNSILTEVFIGIVGLVLTVVGSVIAVLIDKYVKNEKLKTTINSFHELTRSSVLTIYQTYVEELKDKDMFDKKAQKSALQACLMLIKGNMSQNVKQWLTDNVSDIDGYIKDEIEAQIGALKNSGK